MRNGKNPITVLANAYVIDTAAAYLQLFSSGLQNYDATKSPLHTCLLQRKERNAVLTAVEMGDMRMQGLSVDPASINSYAVAFIMGVHFKAGEWGKRPTCSSVITCVINGRSLYGRVTKFLTIDGDSCPGYASVCWFGAPQYPLGDNRLEVVVSDDGRTVTREVGCIVRITQIDPSPVVVEPDGSNKFRMMRQSGYDTIIQP